jgi:hypothetical protein
MRLVSRGETMDKVTFRGFSQVAKRRGHTPDSLAEMFRGRIEDPREFFERVMSCKWRGDDRSDVVVPYRSVIEFYNAELRPRRRYDVFLTLFRGQMNPVEIDITPGDRILFPPNQE